MASSNLLKRIASAIALGFVVLFAVTFEKSQIPINLLVVVCCGLVIREWVELYKLRKKDNIFLAILCYFVAPFLFWLVFVNLIGRYSVYLLWILISVWSCDIFAYFSGKLIGGPKFAPTISPNKTWSGTIIGFICSVVISGTFLKKYGYHQSSIAFVSTSIISVAAIVGDLIESRIKRYLGVKDTGSIIPGHGGVIDRLDSFILASYAFVALLVFGAIKPF